MRISPLALAAGLLSTAGGAHGQPAGGAGPLPSPNPGAVAATAKAAAEQRLPITLQAQRLQGRPDLDAQAEGDVQFNRGDLEIRADQFSYDLADDLAVARGKVRISRDGSVFTGTELQLRVQRMEGFFLQPTFEFEQLGAGGRAERVDFLDRSRSRALDASYTSCPRDGSGDPDWVLQADSVTFDLDANEGLAEGAVLRFLGVPILALPVISFPLTDARKSGWLPPSLNIDSGSGVEVGVPYYWNIAPNRDATLAPRVMSRRGFGLQAEFRYLEPRFEGAVDVDLLPNDRVADRSRQALTWNHQGELGHGLRYGAELVRVSDDAWWKDFPDGGRSLTQRLLPSRALVERPFELAGGSGLAYARLEQWQVLQDADSPILSPYQRSPQLGLQLDSRFDVGLGSDLEARLTTEMNRFSLPTGEQDPGRPAGWRWHAQGSLSHPWRWPGAWVEPKLTLRAVSYRLEAPLADGRTAASWAVPTFSVGAGLDFERETEGFGRALRQTLEPGLLYVHTPYREQSGLPDFDTAGKDFNFSSIYSDNAFSGSDRVSDSHQITAGITTRVIDDASGSEALRLGIVQRYLLSDQQVTAQPDGSVDGPPLEQRFSDVLLLGSTSVVPRWVLEGALQYSPDISRPVRSVFSARYSPGPFRTIGATYRLTRSVSEQIELGWQWPLWTGSQPSAAAQANASGVGAAVAARGGACGGTWYTVGRVNYSMQDNRLTDAIMGFEYDAGCWIARVVAEQLSTGRTESTTRLLLQLELVGLSRIGSNPLRVLKDNIPGYRLLRDDSRGPTDAPPND